MLFRIVVENPYRSTEEELGQLEYDDAASHLDDLASVGPGVALESLQILEDGEQPWLEWADDETGRIVTIIPEVAV